MKHCASSASDKPELSLQFRHRVRLCHPRSCTHTPARLCLWALGIAKAAERCCFEQVYQCTEIRSFHLYMDRYNMCLVNMLPKSGSLVWAHTCPMWILILYWCNSVGLEEKGEVEFHCGSWISFLKVNIQQLTREHVTGADNCFLFFWEKHKICWNSSPVAFSFPLWSFSL